MEAKNRLFVDANFFIALFHIQDSLHQEALNLNRRLDAEQRQLVLSNFIFSEVITVLSMKRGVATALESGESLLTNPSIEIMYIDRQLQNQTWEIYKELKMKNLSFIDCSTIAIMQAESLRELLTFDLKDFRPLTKKYRFRLIS